MTLMKNMWRALAIGFVTAGLFGFCAGCDSGGSSNDKPSGPPVSVLGKWEGVAPDGFNLMLEFTKQVGTQASGRGATHGTGGDLSGTVSGDTVAYVIVWPTGSQMANGTGGASEGTGKVKGNTMTINSAEYSRPFDITLQ
jgi:hypothetical protein